MASQTTDNSIIFQQFVHACLTENTKLIDIGPLQGEWRSYFTDNQQCGKCSMGLLPDTYNCGLRMRRECRERFPRHRLQRKPPVSDPNMHHGTCFTYVPWCMAGSLTRGGGENVPGIPGTCTTRNFAYLARGPCSDVAMISISRLSWSLLVGRLREGGSWSHADIKWCWVRPALCWGFRCRLISPRYDW